MSWILFAAAIVVAGAALYGGHRLALYAEDRGWIYYRNKGRRGTPWLGSLEMIYQPSIEHVIDEIAAEEIRADQDESGEGGSEDPVPEDGSRGGPKTRPDDG